MTSRRLPEQAVSAAVVLALLTGCASGADSGGRSADGTPPSGQAVPSTAPTPTPSPSPRKAFDPPTLFTRGEGAWPLPPDARPKDILLDGTTVYRATDSSIEAYVSADDPDPASTGPANHGNLSSTPVLADATGQRVVLTAFRTVVKGQGTSVDRTAIELVAMDAATHRQAWTVPVDLPADYTGFRALSVLGVRGTTAVLAATGPRDGGLSKGPSLVIAVDLAAKKTLWIQKDVVGAALAGDQVLVLTAGDSPWPLPAALKVSDGSTAWAWDKGRGLYYATLHPAGPNRIVLQGDTVRMEHVGLLLDTATGQQVADLGKVGNIPLTCTYDDRSVTVCAVADETGAFSFAVEPATGKTLWRLPDDAKTRVSPRVTAVWHGIVYGTTSNGPVALNAVTGQDLPSSPQVAPIAVSAYMGVGTSSNGATLGAYPAVG